MTPREIDQQVMGDVAVPPHVRAKGDRNLFATLRLTKYAVSTLRRPRLEPLATARADATR